MENPTTTLKTADKKAYMREYMRKRYHDNKEQSRAYKNSVKCKNKNNLPPEELKEFGIYLSDIYRLRMIKQKLPTELFEKIIFEKKKED